MGRLRLALGTICAVLAATAFVAVVTPSGAGLAATGPSASVAQYCPAAVRKARQAAVQRYKRQLAAQRRAYFRTTRSAKLRRAFVRKQNAQLKALQRAVKACR